MLKVSFKKSATKVKAVAKYTSALVDNFTGTVKKQLFSKSDRMIPSVGTASFTEEVKNEKEGDRKIKQTFVHALGPANHLGFPTRVQPTTSSIQDAIKKRLTAPIDVEKSDLPKYKNRVLDITRWIFDYLVSQETSNFKLQGVAEYLNECTVSKKRAKYAKILRMTGKIEAAKQVKLFVKNELYGGVNGYNGEDLPTKPLRFISNVPDDIVKDTIICSYNVGLWWKSLKTKNFIFASGMNSLDLGDKMCEFLEGTSNVFSSDFSSYEGSQNKYTFEVEMLFFKLIAEHIGISSNDIDEAIKAFNRLAILPL